MEDAAHIVHGMRESIGELFEMEKPLLLPLPERAYDCFRLHPVRSNKMGIVSFETNCYSVPSEYALKNLFIKAYFDRIEIIDAKRVISVHKRLFGKHEESLSPVHYLEALKRKPGSIEFARPLKNSEFSPVLFQFLERLKQKMSESEARKAFLKVFELSAAYPLNLLADAMEMALLYGSLEADSVKNLLVQMSTKTTIQLPAAVPDAININVEVRDVRLFDNLLMEAAR
jgi:hypothetical protein